MPGLRMDESVQQPAADHSACADAGSDRDIDEVIEAGSSTPEEFAQASAVRVSIEADGNVAGTPFESVRRGPYRPSPVSVSR